MILQRLHTGGGDGTLSSLPPLLLLLLLLKRGVEVPNEDDTFAAAALQRMDCAQLAIVDLLEGSH